jgi:hypothetical protein
VTVDPELPEAVSADQGMLYKVLSMLLGNALKFTSSGQVALEVRRVAGRAGDMVRFSVSDTGIGIAKEDLERIFGDFTQSDGSLTRSYPGLGLGLGLARRMTELMGGRIWAESCPEGGSTFHAEIPLLIPEKAALPQAAGPGEVAEPRPHPACGPGRRSRGCFGGGGLKPPSARKPDPPLEGEGGDHPGRCLEGEGGLQQSGGVPGPGETR